ncbi:hypothetical protein BJY04DRAFT_225941 [Aspergillus karnatakaensis]|uniref:uncharacterized protein n=1 Tax=Aspergillus karnatakaensis TaxID=1810916 RepID=UPI003CCD5ED1
MAPSNNKIVLTLVPVEIWALVIDFVCLLRLLQSALHSLNLSCRGFHEIVSPVLFKTLRIRFPRGRRDLRDNKHTRLHELLGPDNLVNIHQYVRFLTLCGPRDSTADSYGALLSKLVESLPNLESIRWRSMLFPPQLVRTLNARQQPPLLYYGVSQPLAQDDLLLGAPFIKSLNVTYSSHLKSPYNIEINALGAVILSLPKLNRLVLKYNPGPQIFRGVERPIRSIFELPPASILPPLRILYSLHLDLDGATDMTMLINHLSDCPGAVSNLRSVSFRIHDATRAENISRVTSSLDKLLCQITHLSVFPAKDLPKEVLHKVDEHHRSTLRQLRWRHTWFPLLDVFFVGWRELNHIGVRRSGEDRSVACIFTPGELRDLAKKLPRIEQLGVDLCFRRNTDLCSSILPTAQIPRAKLAIAAEKNRHGKEASAEVSQSRFMQLAIKAGEWESFPWDANDLIRRYVPFAIVCWREEAIGARDGIQRLRVEFQLGLRQSFLEENKFEQIMDAAGLWGGRKERGLDFGPRVW